VLHDNFIIHERLGVGATAEVFAAVSRADGSLRALKVFSPLVLEDADTIRRIETESEALRRLKHPNIVRLLGTCRSANEFALELELVQGTDLRRWRRDYSLRLVEPLVWILSQVAKGVACAHENGVLHRDLKPENILIANSGEVKLTDFGLARQLDTVTMTKSGLLTGSMGYMAPELINGERSTEAADLFSFGTVAYELLCGKNPFAGPNPQSVLKKVLTGQFTPLDAEIPGLPAKLVSLIHLCLSPDPARRPQSIWHVEAELMALLARSPLHRLCPALVAVEKRTTVLELAYQEKRRELAARRERLLAEGRREGLVELATEWSRLFPDAQESAEILASLPEPGRKAFPYRTAAVAALLLLLLIPLFWWQLRPPRQITVSQMPPAQPEPHAAQARPPQEAAPQSPQVMRPAPRPKGWLQVDADDDVTVFVDNKQIPQRLWARIPVEAGTRRLRLVKAGFLPIENEIEVKANKVAVVKAKREVL
jgi:serine/threonine protein kinase